MSAKEILLVTLAMTAWTAWVCGLGLVAGALLVAGHPVATGAVVLVDCAGAMAAALAMDRLWPGHR